MHQPISIALSKDEALVLLDFLSRFAKSDSLNIEDQAEEQALNNLCCLLEKELVEPFQPTYNQSLSDARKRLRSTE